MRILLAAPSQADTYGSFSVPDYPPLGLAYLGAVLEQAGHQVSIVDVGADKISDEDFLKCLKIGDYRLVGITTTTPTFNSAIRLCRLVKDNSGALVVLGGIHVTVRPEESMQFDSVDFIVRGEGERTIAELVDCLEGRRELESVDGIYYRENGKILKNKERELISNLDEIPFPSRHLFNQQKYTYPDTLYRRTFPIITSRGCPANCTYCNAENIFKRRFRVRSPGNVVEEIEGLIKRFNAQEIHIWDDNFTTIKTRVFKIRDEVRRRKIKIKFAFPNGLRADYVDEDILKTIKDMGTYSVAFGVESGNQKILDSINKNIKLEQIELVFKLAKKIGLETWAFFMFGLPTETADTMKDTIDFAIKLNPDVAKFHILKPFPGTEVYNELLSQNLILNNNFDAYGIHTRPVHRLKGLRTEQILDWQKRAYRSFYFRANVLLKQALRLKSLNRLKLNFIAGKNVLKSIIR